MDSKDKISFNPPPTKNNWFLRHEVLYSIVGGLILVVIIGSAYWWKEIKKQNVTIQQDSGSIAGLDADNNGVWDYVQAYIDAKHSGSQKTRLALYQQTKAVQNLLLNADNKSLSINNNVKLLRSYDCIEYVMGVTEGYKIFGEVLAQILNNYARSKAYAKVSQAFPGVYTLTPQDKLKEQCEFDPDAVETTKDWKTYTNTEYGFSFKYPSDWYTGTSQTPDPLMKEYIKVLNRNPEDDTGICSFVYDDVARKENEDLKDWNNRINKENGSPPDLSIKDISIDNKNGIEVVSGEIGIYHSVYLPLNSTTILAVTYYCGPKADQGFEVINQILSTFKFTK